MINEERSPVLFALAIEQAARTGGINIHMTVAHYADEIARQQRLGKREANALARRLQAAYQHGHHLIITGDEEEEYGPSASSGP